MLYWYCCCINCFLKPLGKWLGNYRGIWTTLCSLLLCQYSLFTNYAPGNCFLFLAWKNKQKNTATLLYHWTTTHALYIREDSVFGLWPHQSKMYQATWELKNNRWLQVNYALELDTGQQCCLFAGLFDNAIVQLRCHLYWTKSIPAINLLSLCISSSAVAVVLSFFSQNCTSGTNL